MDVAKHKKDSNLSNRDGTVGSSFVVPPSGEAYCDSCGSAQPQRIDVYHPETDTWERGVPCPMHWSHPH